MIELGPLGEQSTKVTQKRTLILKSCDDMNQKNIAVLLVYP